MRTPIALALACCGRSRAASALPPIVALVACTAGADPEPGAGRAAGAVREAGAGTILETDPSLRAIVPADSEIEKLHDGFGFTEGPLWIDAGRPHLLFSDIPGNVVYRWTEAEGPTEFLRPVFEGEYERGRFVGSNGLTLDHDGRVVMAEHGHRRISRLEPDGSRTALATAYQGRRFNSPNDLVYRSDGWLYFTDPPFGLPRQDRDRLKELDFNGIYRLSPDGRVELLERDLRRPNGIAFSPDEGTLYVSSSDPRRQVWIAYEVRPDGTLGPGRLFFDATSHGGHGHPDGLKVDTEGRLYAAGPGGVWIFGPDGRHLGTIRPEEVPANVAWGDDGSTLYMTARSALYRIRLRVEGVRPRLPSTPTAPAAE